MAWKPLIVCPQPALAQKISSALRELSLEAAILPDYPRMGAIAGMAARERANICFLDVASNPEHAQLLIAEMAPEVPVVALHHRAEGDLILRCLRRGVFEFLTEITAEGVRGVFERLSRARSPAPAATLGKIYCVAPGKPGCGASTVASHLAVRLAGDANPSLLVDCDPLNASVAFQLKLKPEFHLGDVLRDWGRMDNDLWSRLTLHVCGIDVLAAPENPAARIELQRPAATELCKFWRERYSAVVLDLPDVRAAGDSGFAVLADAILLVGTNELAALQSTRRAIEYLDQTSGDRSRLRLIINRYTPSTGLTRTDVKTALRVEPYGVLCNDYEAIQTALLEGRPAAAGSAFRSSIDALAGQLLGCAAQAKRNGSWLGLFSRGRSK